MKRSRLILAALAAAALVWGVPTLASADDRAVDHLSELIDSAEYQEAVESLAVVVNVDALEATEKSIRLADGTTLTVGIEPIKASHAAGKFGRQAALSGWWRIYGTNALAYMEYRVRFAPVSTGSSYTKVAQVDQNSLIINAWAGTSFTSETIVVRRTNETSTLPAWVQGRAVFTYANGALTLTGGVEALVKNGAVTVQLW